MKFSFKKIAAAVALAATAASASAAIDNGALGNGELFFNIWDSAGSYTRSLEVSIDSFQSLIAADGSLNLVFAADTAFTSFLSTASLSSLQWNVQAVDTLGARRLLETYTTMPSTTISNDKVRTAAGNVQTLATQVNNNLNGADSVAVTSGSSAYAGKYGTKINGVLDFSNGGSLTNDSFDNGLNFMRIDAAATGTVASKYTQYADTSSAIKVWLDSNSALHIAAVPEPESYAMLLAGLGMVGFMARRRLGKRA